MTARAQTVLGAALAVLALGLPWQPVPATPGTYTLGYYTAGYCDYEGYCSSGVYVPGYYIPGLPGGAYTGLQSDVRFFVAAAVVLALVGGLHLGHARALRWATYAALAGVALYLANGLTGGIAVLAAAAACFWLAARRHAGLSTAS